MSASERLRELNLGAGYIDDAELSTMGYDGLLALRNAFPEIVAVVEAAAEPAHEVTGDGIRGWEPLYPDLTAALAALEEKLKPAEDKKEPTPAFDEWEKHWKTKP